MRWIRLEVAFDETWLFPLSNSSQLAWVKLLCTAKRDGVRGVLKYVSPAVASRKWNIPENDVEAMYAAAVADGAIVIENDQIQICNWLKYQPLDKTAAQRQKKFKESKKTGNGRLRQVTPLSPVTPIDNGRSREVTAGNDRKRRYIDVDVDIDVDSKGQKPSAPNGAATAKYPDFPVADSQRFHRTCIQHGHAVDMGVLRKTIAPLYPKSGPIYTADQINSALEAWLEAREGQPPDKARFWKITEFAQDVARWVRLGAMPRSDANGVTERGRLAAGG